MEGARPQPPAVAQPASGAIPFAELQRTVIHAGLCTHCGTCVGLAGGALRMVDTAHGPLPQQTRPVDDLLVPPEAWAACPGRGIDYPDMNQWLFGRQPASWLLGCVRGAYIGHSRLPHVRRAGASGGVITQTLLTLLESGRVDGAVVVRQGRPAPWQARPVIARTPEQLLAASQSVYVPVPVNAMLEEMERFPGRLAYVGLPDQVAALRRLQQMGHPGAGKVDYVLGPYVGTAMTFSAVESYLRSHGVRDLREVVELRYREGEWPGYLQIKLRSGRVLRAEKFYYNYLIPFHITRSSLLSVDLSNELTDVSVGDAWHPRYEARGAGFSVVLARSSAGAALLDAMRQRGLVALTPLPIAEAVAMHGHMLDFKKRGGFIRLDWRRRLGRPTPDYGYHPLGIPLARRLVELVVSGLFAICGTPLARRAVEFVPLWALGPLFDGLRRAWKALSKPTKRRGLPAYAVDIHQPEGEGTRSQAAPER